MEDQVGDFLKQLAAKLELVLLKVIIIRQQRFKISCFLLQHLGKLI